MKLTQSTTIVSVHFDAPTITQTDRFVCATATLPKYLPSKLPSNEPQPSF